MDDVSLAKGTIGPPRNAALLVSAALVCVFVLASTSAVDAAILCQKRSGGVVVRDACRQREVALDLAEFLPSSGATAPIAYERTIPGSAAIGPTSQPYAQLRIPAGHYLVIGTFYVASGSLGGPVSCRLAVDCIDEFGNERYCASLSGLAQSPGGVLTVSTVVDLAEPQWIALWCYSDPPTGVVNAESPTITAVPIRLP